MKLKVFTEFWKKVLKEYRNSLKGFVRNIDHYNNELEKIFEEGKSDFRIAQLKDLNKVLYFILSHEQPFSGMEEIFQLYLKLSTIFETNKSNLRDIFKRTEQSKRMREMMIEMNTFKGVSEFPLFIKEKLNKETCIQSYKSHKILKNLLF